MIKKLLLFKTTRPVVLVLLSIIANTWAVAQPVISSFTPTSGSVGTTVTITGTNFNTTPANNIVFFGATQATVSEANDTSLTVTVPTGATYQPISVTDTTTGLSAYCARPFITTFNSGDAFNAASFAAKVDSTTGTNPFGISMGDLNVDGKPDLVIANYGTNTVSVFRNTSTSGNVSFDAKADYTAGTNPFSISVGDLDGDGKPDLITANFNSISISVFRNTSTGSSITFVPKLII